MTLEEALRLCLRELGAGRIDPAERLCEELTRRYPREPVPWHVLGIIAARRDRHRQAMEYFGRSLEIRPAAPAVHYEMAVARYRAGLKQEAITGLDAAIALAPDHSDAWNLRGRILLEFAAYEGALASFDQVLQAHPDQVDALANRGDPLRLLGRGAEAQAAYRDALQRDPKHPRALLGIGLLAAEAGRWRDALSHHDRALAASPNFAEAHNGRGVALSGLGEHAAALASFARALALRPGYVDALINTGNTLRKMGRLEEALSNHDQAVGADPASIEALYSRAGVLLDLVRLDEALDACDRALAVRPRFPPALLRRGNVLLRLNRPEDAIEAFDQALALPEAPAPYRAETHFLRATAFRQLERMDDAVAGFDDAITLRADFIEAWLHRGTALRDMNELLDSLYSYDKALEINPHHVETLNNRTVLLAMLNRNEEAVTAGRLALQLDPGNAVAYNNLGNSLRRLGRNAEASEAYDAAMRTTTDPQRVRLNHAMCLLQAGDFERGWQLYEARWETDARPIPLDGVRAQLWRGQVDPAGKTIVVYSEQGLGDSIQFVRYVPMLVERGAHVLLGVPEPLRRLYRSLGQTVELFEQKEVKRPFDLHSPLMSLPLGFGTCLATIPDRVPYLAPPEECRRLWRRRLGPRRGPRIGLAWSGSSGHREDSGRSIPLELFGPIFASLPEVYSLQRDLRPADVPALAMYPGLRFFGHDLTDFADTAALAEQMDLIIAVDTSVLHLAGALARPVWALIPFAADWRWMYDREDSPWYPTMRLFRQRSPTDWQSVVDRVRDALARFPGDALPLSAAQHEHPVGEPAARMQPAEPASGG